MATDSLAIRADISRRLSDSIDEAMRRENATSGQDLSRILYARDRRYKFSQQDFQAWKKKGRLPGLERLPLLAEALGVDWRWLLVGDKEIAPQVPIVIRRGERQFSVARYVENAPDDVSVYVVDETIHRELRIAATAARALKKTEKR